MSNGEKDEKKPENRSEKDEKSSRRGYDFYPQRKEDKEEPGWFRSMFGFEKGLTNKICQRNVEKVISESPLVKLLLGALKTSGCEVDINRHICCEKCSSVVSGGYDMQENQIIICEENGFNKTKIEIVLAHELVHMFDYCRNKLEIDNLEHLACTEIRAANLARCNWLEAMFTGVISPFALKKAHQNCIKDMAARSIATARQVPKDKAMEVVEKVFTRCYNDLEPVGRWMSWTYEDKRRACLDGFLYGYECS